MLRNRVQLGPADHAGLVDEEDRALRQTVFAQHAVLARNRAVRMVVTEQVVRNATERVGPSFLGRARIVADGEHVGVEPLERRALALVRLYLRTADGRERERMERDN